MGQRSNRLNHGTSRRSCFGLTGKACDGSDSPLDKIYFALTNR